MTQKVDASSSKVHIIQPADRAPPPQEHALSIPEIIEHMFSFLDEPALNKAGLVCKLWKQISDNVWSRFIFKTVVPTLQTSAQKNIFRTWLSLIPMEQIGRGSVRFERLIFDFAENPTRYFSQYQEEFMEMKECSCPNFSRTENNRRKLLENRIIEYFTQNHPDRSTCIKILSLGCGALLQDFILILRLINQGYRNFNVLLVDPQISEQSEYFNNLRATISFIRDVNLRLVGTHLLYKKKDSSKLKAIQFTDEDIKRARQMVEFQDNHNSYGLDVKDGIAYAFDFDEINNYNYLTVDPNLQAIAHLCSEVRENRIGAFFCGGNACDWEMSSKNFEVLHVIPSREIKEFKMQNADGTYKIRIAYLDSLFEILFLPLKNLLKRNGDLSNVEIWYEKDDISGNRTGEEKRILENAFPGLKIEIFSRVDIRKKIRLNPLNVLVLGSTPAMECRNFKKEIANLPQQLPNTPRVSCYEILPYNRRKGYKFRELTKYQMQLLSYL